MSQAAKKLRCLPGYSTIHGSDLFAYAKDVLPGEVILSESPIVERVLGGDREDAV